MIFKLPSQNQLNIWQEAIIKSYQEVKAPYLQNYTELLSASKSLYSAGQFNALGYMAYGWMPTICKKFNEDVFNSENWQTACESNDIDDVINAISNIDTPPFNNSWVGTSKVLHFINPTIIPIWDSRVRNTFDLYNLHNVKTLYTNKQISFVSYIKHAHELLDELSVCLLKKFLDEKYKFNHSEIRVLELIYFNASKIS